ncbi:MAG TPA: enoyl-CoA hydratase-related protein [Candidatus Limnocylindrales bacterium]|nr:enoyl-CoA hydratase-related protein [Candidatus Limnocylindrales bacterium]
MSRDLPSTTTPMGVPTSPSEAAAPIPAYASPAGAHVRLDADAYDPEVDRLAVRREGDLVVIELADHDRRNTMGLEMTAAWSRLMAGIAADSDVRAVLLTGQGSAFSSGGNTSWIGADSHEPVSVLRERMLAYYQTWLMIRDLPMPTIAAINGPAIGAGAALALACDIRWAGESASMSVPFLRMGMHPGMLSTFLLTEVAGVAAARDLLFTGRRVGAGEMLSLGLVSRVLPDDELAAEALAGAQGVAGGAPVAVQLTKVALRDGGPRDRVTATQWEGLAQAVTLASDDLAEGLAALREKRPPHFTGR